MESNSTGGNDGQIENELPIEVTDQQPQHENDTPTASSSIWDSNVGYTPFAATTMTLHEALQEGGEQMVISSGPNSDDYAYVNLPTTIDNDINNNDAYTVLPMTGTINNNNIDDNGAYYGADDNYEYCSTSNEKILVDDFEQIANQALQALELDYQRVVQGTPVAKSWNDWQISQQTATTTSSDAAAVAAAAINDDKVHSESTILDQSKEKKKEPDVSLDSIIPAVERKNEIIFSNETNMTAAERDDTTADISSLSPTKTTIQQQDASFPVQKWHEPINPQKVAEAVQSMSLSNKFQFKFDQWQQQQQSQPHANIIPKFIRSIFTNNSATGADIDTNDKKVQEQTRLFSRSATMAEAMIRLNIQSQQSKRPIIIHIVGVDSVECASQDTIETMVVGPLLSWLSESKLYKQTAIKFHLVGRDLTPNQLHSFNMDNIHSVTCHAGVYHSWLLVQDDLPDFSIAFNAGIWGYSEWQETIKSLAQSKNSRPISFVITAYTLAESKDDYDVINGLIVSDDSKITNAKVLWKPELNIYASKQERKTNSKDTTNYENAAWQAWQFG